MNERKRIFSALLALALLLSCLPQVTLVAEAATMVAAGDCGANGDNVTWTLDDAGTLTISGTGAMKDFNRYCPWGGLPTTVVRVSIQSGITKIGNYAFHECSGLTDVEIPDSVTDIGDYAFKDCTSLTAVDIPDSVTSIGVGMYAGCTGLTAVEIPDSITTIGAFAFSGCKNLTRIKFSSTVTAVGMNAFAGSVGLSRVEISDIGAWCAVDFEDRFANPLDIAQKLYINGELVEELVIPEGVPTIGDYAFIRCTGLTSVKIPTSVTAIGESAFSACSALKNIYFDGSAPVFGSQAFAYVNASAYYYPDETWTSSKMQNYGSGIITWVALEDKKIVDSGTFGMNGDNLTWVLDSTSTLTISGKGMMPGSMLGNAPWNKYRTALQRVIIEDGVTSIGSSAFANCYNLLSVEIADSVTLIMSGAFAAAIKLDRVEIPASVTNIVSGAFSGCTSLLEISVDPDNKYFCDQDGVLFDKNMYTLICYPAGKRDTAYTIPETVTLIEEYAFSYCEYLTEVENNNSVAHIWENAFSNCSELASVHFGDSLLSIGDYAFYYCTSLTSLNIGNSVERIGDDAFYYCYELPGLALSDTLTSIGERAFYNCNSITGVEIGASVTTIGEGAFASCGKMESITVDPDNGYYCDIDGVLFSKDKKMIVCYPGGRSGTYSIPDSVTTIGDSAFDGCSGLTSVEIPDSVTTIGSYAFQYCDRLEKIRFAGSAPAFGTNVFKSVKATAYYYPDESWTEAVMQNYGGTITWVALECEHTYTACVQQPSCAEEGYTLHTCSKCGDSYKDSYTGKLNHVRSPGELPTIPHCTVVKYDSFTCANCGETIYAIVNPVGHKHTVEAVVEPGCETGGYTRYACSLCGDSYTDSETQPTGHDYGEDGVCDKCRKVYGDFTGNSKLDREDAEYLLWHTIYGEELYPVGSQGDYDGDGVVTDKDVCLLLLYIMLPGKFPLPGTV